MQALDLDNARMYTPDDGPLDVAAETTETPGSAPAARGARIGQYKILHEIGEGGFGLVYLARQEHPVQRDVAIKVIKAGMDTREVVARFEAERQARGSVEEAIGTIEKALAFPADKVPATSLTRALARSALGACLTARREYAAAEKMLKEADEYFGARAQTPAATRARQRIVELYTAWGRPREAEAFRPRR